jgi:CRISPR-associated protein Cmr6
MIPIPEKQQKLLKSSRCNFSLYFHRMVNWDYRDVEVTKDSNAIDNLGKKANELFQNANEVLNKIHSHQNDLLKHHYFLSKYNKKIKIFEFTAKLASPLISGLGSGHPNETGMILDRNTGLPYIPASSIKGVLRLAHCLNLYEKYKAQKNIDNDANANKWLERGKLNSNGKFLKSENPNEGDVWFINDNEPSIIRYFGSYENINDNEPSIIRYSGSSEKISEYVRGQLVFLDAFPYSIPEIKTDIMTPHYSTYYMGPEEKNEKRFEGPIETDATVPIKFLSVAPGTEFVFRCFISPLVMQGKGEASWGVEDDNAIEAMFERALTKIGIGGKTSIGYGHFNNFKNSSVDLINNWEKIEEQKRIEAEKKRKIEENKAEAAKKEAEKKQKELALLEKISLEMATLGTGTGKKEKGKIEKRKALLTFVQSVIKGEQSKITEGDVTRIADSICGSSKEEIEDFHINAAKAILNLMKKNSKWLNTNDRRKKLDIIARQQ